MLLSLNLPPKDYIVMSGGSMLAHGLKDFINDLDIYAKDKAWEKACSISTPIPTSRNVGQVIKLFDEKIEILNKWAPGEWNVDELINTADIIEGIQFINLEYLEKWMLTSKREKDLVNAKIIREYLNSLA